ncbi:MAG: ABC transporter permease [Bacteroidales bacterium]|nr:ABC transporter permease [Bacteroidales bacterium]
MKIHDMFDNDYFRLFVKREVKVILGRRFSNLWLLASVLTATFLAIAFSNASLDYLSYKMDDPFINWVDIRNEHKGRFLELENALKSSENKERFHYASHQTDYYSAYDFYGINDDVTRYLKGRFFERLDTDLVREILKDGNVVRNWKINDVSSVDENTIGVIITEEALKDLGYDRAPSFIYYKSGSPDIEWAYEYGVDIIEQTPRGAYARAPLPVLAVVKKLPGNVDFISNSYLHEQLRNSKTWPFDLAREAYAENLCYFVPEDVDMDDFRSHVLSVSEMFTTSEIEADETSFYVREIIPFREGSFVKFLSYDFMEYGTWLGIHREVIKKYGSKDVHRVFEYEFSDETLTHKSYISVYFEDLDKLRDFEKYVYDTFEVKIEMAQVNAKENFNAVSVMGNILSWVIIVFAIICIILFIVNLLQSYFQKVKRNLGTFKAFGFSNRNLISIYMLIMAAIIFGALSISVTATWLVQGLLHVCGILKDGIFDYLLLWSHKTVSCIAIIMFAAVCTVYFVMRNLLKATPGDLIYDR